jgi:hypothetical protein
VTINTVTYRLINTNHGGRICNQSRKHIIDAYRFCLKFKKKQETENTCNFHRDTVTDHLDHLKKTFSDWEKITFSSFVK